MASPGIDGPLTDREIDIIQQLAVNYRSGIDLDTIENLIQGGSKNIQRLLKQEYTDLSSEEKIAFQMLMAREASYDKEYLGKSLFLLMEGMINTGANAIREYGHYFRFEPCIELIFELESEELNKIAKYMHKFELSDYSTTTEQYRHELQDHRRNVFSIEEGGELVAEVLEMYESITGLYETTLPNLLALKRILDGETPSNEVLQNKNLSSVCRELLNTKEEPNSVYFDLIVNKYDTDLRNGLSHGDIINDTVSEEVRVPSDSVCYSYTEIGEIGEQNLSNATFLTGFYRALIYWRMCTCEIENTSRERLDI